MKAHVVKIIEPGNLDKERVVIRFTSASDVGEYLFLRTGRSGDGVDTSVSRTYWFPDKEVSKGDLVVLYSKRGAQNERDIGKNKYHFFYWGSGESLWDDEASAGVLMHAPDWNSFRVGDELA